MVGVRKSDYVPRRLRYKRVSLMWKAVVANEKAAHRAGSRVNLLCESRDG